MAPFRPATQGILPLSVLLGLSGGGCHLERAARPLPQGSALAESVERRASTHRFPKLANQYQLCCRGESSLVLFDQLPLWDLAIVDAETILTLPDYLGAGGRIRAANPQALLLAYFSAADANLDLTLPINQGFLQNLAPAWYLRDTRGDQIRLYELEPGQWTLAMNEATPFSEYLPRYLTDNVVSSGLVDGIFYDWATTEMSWLNHRSPPLNGPVDIDNDGRADSDRKIDARWTRGYSRMLSNSRRLFPRGTLVLGNAGWRTGPAYSSLLNGVMIERFLDGESVSERSLGWMSVMRSYAHYQTQALPPRLSILMANRDDPRDFQFMRFALASALMFDGYFCFTNRSVPSSYATAWWYDEYAVDLSSGLASPAARFKGYLGLPISAAFDAARPRRLLRSALRADDAGSRAAVWRRDFEHGVVLVNPTRETHDVDLGGRFRKIRGTGDPAFNDGARLAHIALQPRSGAVLLKDDGELPL